MDTKFYLPWSISAKAILWGYNEEGVRFWNCYKAPKLLLSLKYGANIYITDDYLTRGRSSFFEGTADLKLIFKSRYIVSITVDQLKIWFSEKYDIDFIERPVMAREKTYICDPVGAGLGDVRLEACKTLREAQENAFEYLFEHVKPLPLNIEEEIQEVEFKND